MAFMESFIAYDTAINNETAKLSALSPTSLTTRTGYGNPKLTHLMALTSTDDVDRVYVVPSGYSDANGIPCPLIAKYSATTGFDFISAKLSQPVEIPENTQLNVYATSETAADSVVFVLGILEYPNGGNYMPIQSGPGLVHRFMDAGATLTSNTIASGTSITDLAAGIKYQPSMIANASVDGSTAGITGPAFVRFDNPEMDGANLFLPLVNAGAYWGGEGMLDFARCGIKMPAFAGGTAFRWSIVDYTAERPTFTLGFVANKKLFP